MSSNKRAVSNIIHYKCNRNITEETSNEEFEVLIPSIDQDPIQVFRSWLIERQNHPLCNVHTANFATLSTVDMTSSPPRPSSRVISVADLNQDGHFVFTTTLTSAKSQQLMKNSSCNLVYNWPRLRKQVRIDGNAQIANDTISEQIWSNKDRSYWIWACSTQQIREIDNIDSFQQLMVKTAAKYETVQNIPRPSNWSAWIIQPIMIEFWRGHNEGLHNRHRYERQPFGQALNPWTFTMIEP